MTEYSPAKTGEYPRIFLNFQNCAHCEKDFKDGKHKSLHLGQKYARIFVLGCYLFLQATLSENCVLLRTDIKCPRTNILAYFHAKWGQYKQRISKTNAFSNSHSKILCYLVSSFTNLNKVKH